jgi:catechol 2,3-dioxygenase-like lactoylglutathione lyase family enzyme
MSDRKPAFTAPVSRFLAVADIARSVHFYRAVLGFEATEAQGGPGFPATVELVKGPVRIQLGKAESAFDSTGKRRPRGAAMLFFESDDVAAFHAEVGGRGGNPSSLEQVNWIKYRMFQLPDPDGHTLWFGQSFHELGGDSSSESYAERQLPTGRGQLRKIIPELPLHDIPAGVAHYRDVLGFTVNYVQEDFAILDRDSVSIALIPRTGRHQGIGSCSTLSWLPAGQTCRASRSASLGGSGNSACSTLRGISSRSDRLSSDGSSAHPGGEDRCSATMSHLPEIRLKTAIQAPRITCGLPVGAMCGIDQVALSMAASSPRRST